MKTCQNCKARSKDDVIECVHCGTLFGDVLKPDNKSDDSPAVKQTLFGIPAQKLEELLASQEEEPEDLSKRTMAGFNVAGLFGGNEESEISEEEEEEEEIAAPLIVAENPQKTMAGLNVSDLFKDPETVEEPEKETKDIAPQPVESEDPKFGTMLGINVADIMSTGAAEAKKESGPTKTLFSLPAVDGPFEKGAAPIKPTQPKSNTATAAGGFATAKKEDTGFKARPSSKVSLGSLIPKVDLQKKDSAPVIAARPSIQTPVEFNDPAKETITPPEKTTASGILRKRKSGKNPKASDTNKKASVVGSFSVPKESLSETSKPLDNREASLNPEPPIKVDPARNASTQKIGDIPAKTISLDEPPVEFNSSGVKPAEPPTDHIDLHKPAIETKVEKQTQGGNYEGSINTVQTIFIIAGAFIILGSIVALYAKDLLSVFNIITIGFALVTLVGSLGVLFASKNPILKGSVWTISAVLLFLFGAIGAVVSTPLSVLFIFAGALFLISALFPKIVSLL